MSAVGAAAGPDLPLLIWLSPAYPVGGFAYSHGLEAAVEAGLVADAAALAAWIADLLAFGSLRQDAILLALALQASDHAALAEVNALALALCAGRERLLETTAMGNAFLKTIRSTWPGAIPPPLAADVAYPVALAMAAGTERLDVGRVTAAFALAAVATLVSAAVRLGVLGQTDGQRVTAGAVPAVTALASAAARATPDDLGGCALRSDLAALQHETLYSRLFRS